MWLVLFSIVISLLIAIPLGMVQALKRNSVFDYTTTGIVFFLYSVPAFLMGILLIEIFAIQFHLFPAEITPGVGTGPFARLIDIVEAPRSYVLPIFVLVALSVGGYSRFMRGSVLDVLVQDFVRTARAKGASSRRVLYRHAMRNAFIPIITLLGLTLPALFSGAVITESLFNLQGMGTVTVSAVQAHDLPTVMAATLLVAAATVVGNFLADLGVAAADPRVRLTGAK
jgi:peptide/nickel transport system permease protein